MLKSKRINEPQRNVKNKNCARVSGFLSQRIRCTLWQADSEAKVGQGAKQVGLDQAYSAHICPPHSGRKAVSCLYRSPWNTHNIKKQGIGRIPWPWGVHSVKLWVNYRLLSRTNLRHQPDTCYLHQCCCCPSVGRLTQGNWKRRGNTIYLLFNRSEMENLPWSDIYLLPR